MTDITRGISKKQIENERCFAACLFSGSSDIALSECGWLEPSQFIDQKLGEYWANIRAGGDPLQVANTMGIMTELLGYVNKTPSVVRPQEYARGISEYSYTNRIVMGATKLVRAAQDNKAQDIHDELEAMLGLDTTRQSSASYWDSKEVSEAFNETITNPESPSIMTRIPAIDDITGGMFGGDLIVLAGRPGMGKTALALQLARNVAASGKTALFFSLEMHRIQLWARMACGLAGYEWRDVRSGKVDASGKAAIIKQSQNLANTYGDNLIISDTAGETISGMIQITSKIKPDFIVVDHLGEIGKPPGRENDKEVVWFGNATRALRIWLARRNHIPLLLVHQLSRAVESRPDKRPMLSDLRWSGEIEQRSDVVWMLYRDDYYNPSTDVLITGKSKVELWQRKNRQGTMNALMELEYDLKKQWFT
jgi:replicative DNA helicase